MEQLVGEVWRDSLYAAWAMRSRESLDWMLTLSDRFPSQREAAKAWRRRRKFWPLLTIAERLSRVDAIVPAPYHAAKLVGPPGARPSI